MHLEEVVGETKLAYLLHSSLALNSSALVHNQSQTSQELHLLHVFSVWLL